MNYKDTLNLPQTDFPIKYDHRTREPEILALWEALRLACLDSARHKPLAQGKGQEARKKFILHDGPPYPNGDIHLGHALNKILKDIVVKYKTMRGFDSPFVPGWDCHGLPIETQLLKELSVRRSTLSTIEFRQKCRQYALKYVELQKKEFKRLGIRAEWDNPYLTLNPGYEAGVVELFGKLADKGYVYKALKPIHWCPNCETALAEAEIEYEEDDSHAIFVKFDKFVIWTTTPWTLPSNVAIAVHPEYEYSEIRTGGSNFIVASQLLESAAKKMGWGGYEVVKKYKGSELEGLVCRHPFIDRDSKVVLDQFVTLETGTGCVHIAPGHGDEDYKVGLKYKLPIIMPVDEKGRFTEEVPQFTGVSVWKANQPIIDLLSERGALLGNETLKHPYPHCWRCKKPVIFRATEQWFIAVDHDRLRDRVLEQIKKITWIPGWGQNRIRAMVESRPDWCISRQRSWGIPIPAFYCKGCGSPNFKGAFNKAAAELMKKLGSDAWFDKSPEEILPKGTKCEKCGGQEFTKETDIMDVWLESGSSHYSVLKGSKELSWPADLYLEGSDQHRGWFQTSILTSVAGFKESAFRSVLTHGFTIDEKGKKMSKSLGNVVDPQKVVDEYGADVLRLWVASTDFRNDMAVSKNILRQINEGFKKIRNTCRFLLSNLPPHPVSDKVELTQLDRYALLRLAQVIKRVEKAYEEFELHIVYHTLYDYCVSDLSTFYLDIVKDRLYCDSRDSKRRISCQYVMEKILDSMVSMMSPILSFTAQDLLLARGKDGTDQVFPEVEPGWFDTALEERWEKVLEVRAKAYKEVEELRAQKKVSQFLQCDIMVSGAEKDLRPLREVEMELADIFLVSSVLLREGESFSVSAVPTQSKKCQRCWRYVNGVGEGGICLRCQEAVK